MVKKHLLILGIVLGVSAIVVLITLMRPKTPPMQKIKTEQIKNIVPVLIIGSGPAGLSAGLYTARSKLPTLILTGHKRGGQLADVRQIENWPGKKKSSGEEAVEDLLKQASAFGAEIIHETACKIDASVWPFIVRTESDITLRPLALIIATGRLAKRLYIPGVEQYWGKGVGTCTICDAPFHKNEIVAVVGGGDTAADHALQLAEYASKVYMIVREDCLSATETVQEYLKSNKKITIMLNTDILAIQGDEEGVTSATLKHLDTKQDESCNLKGVYFAIGYHPNSELAKSFLPTDEQGFIILPDRTQRTIIPGIFAAGDVVDKRYGKAGIATGSGVKAAIDGIEFLQDIGFNIEKDAIKPLLYKHVPSKTVDIPGVTSVAEFEQIIHAKPAVIIDFYADYCPSCKMLIPHVAEIAKSFNLPVIKVNSSITPELFKRYKIRSVPSFSLFKNGKLVLTYTMIKTKEHLQKAIKQLAAEV